MKKYDDLRHPNYFGTTTTESMMLDLIAEKLENLDKRIKKLEKKEAQP